MKNTKWSMYYIISTFVFIYDLSDSTFHVMVATILHVYINNAGITLNKERT